MLNRRKIVLRRLLNPDWLHCSCFRTNSRRGYGSRKSNAGDNGRGEKQIHLFKSRGQHLLMNNRVLDCIVRTSNIMPDDTVLEIGPGTGNLTLKLLEAARRVVAVEIDDRMVQILRKRIAERGFLDRLNIINGDALRADFPEFNLVVANIPYGISSPLLTKLVYGANANPFRSATLLLQKEFATRLLAKPGDSEFNRLAVNVNLLARVEFVMDVSKRDFVPCPKVDSSVIKIYPRSEVPDVDLNEWCSFTRACFSKKNKTLGAMFKQKRRLMEMMKFSKCEDCDSKSPAYGDGKWLSSEGNSGHGTAISSFRGRVTSVLEFSGFLDKRPSKLSNEELQKLLSLFNEAGLYFHDHARSKEIYDDAFADCDDML